MKKILIFTLFLLIKLFSTAQTVQSSCTAPDSIKLKYAEDADRLALRKIIRRNLTYVDSITIPQIHSDTVMNALMAVYNAISLSARDTVISIYNLHSLDEPGLKYIDIGADSNLSWMQQLKAGIVPTGNNFFDSLVLLYSLNHYQYDTNNLHIFQFVEFKSDSNLNIAPLLALFASMPGVYYTDNGSAAFDGNNITDSIYSDHVELIYSLGWDDCPAGCLRRRFWKFNVYFDCSVEYVGSYGSPIPFTAVNEIDEQLPKIYPNPSRNIVRVDLNTNKPQSYHVTDLTGQSLLKGTLTMNSNTINVSELSAGIYFIHFENISQRSVKLIKE